MIFRKLFFSKEDEFAQQLGYSSWKEALENTFFIFHIPDDAGWYATKMPEEKWAVWKDEGQPPYLHRVFETWENTIKHLKEIFDGMGLPEHNWFPEGFDHEDNVFENPPDKEKKH